MSTLKVQKEKMEKWESNPSQSKRSKGEKKEGGRKGTPKGKKGGVQRVATPKGEALGTRASRGAACRGSGVLPASNAKIPTIGAKRG